ncbi:MAG: TonB-dependent receptor [Bacteroidetes bacterium]|nr:MAG: TonB-dependent receptor [Bacteroidota bacterium]
MRKYLLFFAVCVASLLLANAAFGVSPTSKIVVAGKITDETGMPLTGATAQVVGTTYGAGTNAQGEFELTAHVKQGAEVVVRYAYIGYKSKDIVLAPEVLATPDEVIRVEVQLQEDLLDMEEVVVTGLRTERPIKEVPVITTVISHKEIESINPSDLTSLLEYTVPGIQFYHNSMTGNTEVSYQGLDSKSLVFLVDGEPIAGEGAANNIDFSRISMNDIEKVEVVRGAASTLYDSRAIGGVINIITKKALRPVDLNLTARYQVKRSQQYGVTLGLKKWNLSSFTTGSYRQRETFTLESPKVKGLLEEGKSPTFQGEVTPRKVVDEEVPIYGYEIWDASERLSYSFTRYLKAELNGAYYTHYKPMNVKLRYKGRFNNYSGGGKISYGMLEKHNMDLSYNYNHYEKYYNYVDTDERLLAYQSKKHTVRLNYAGAVGPVMLGAGGEFNHEDLKHRFFKSKPRRKRNDYSLYAQADWAIIEKMLNLVAGVRVDKADGYKFHATPKVTLMYRPWDFINLRAGYAEGYRVPTMQELYMEFSMAGLFDIMGDPGLKAESSRQYSLSAEYNRRGFNFSLSGYYNQFYHKIDYDLVDPNGPMGAYGDRKCTNFPEVNIFGLEAMMTYRFMFGLQLMGTYTYTHDDKKVDGNNTSLTRPHMARGNIMYSHRWKYATLRTSLNAQWGSGIDHSFYDRNPGQEGWKTTHYKSRFIMGANIGADFPRGIAAGFTIDNLLNHKDTGDDVGVQMPQDGIQFIFNLGINLADAIGW